MKKRLCMLNKTPLDALSLRVIEGLSSQPKTLPSDYFYDDEGSRLFQRIMDLPGYYLSRAERDILVGQSEALLACLSPDALPFDLIELGSGDGSKTLALCRAFDSLGASFVYRPVDISGHAIGNLCRAFEQSKVNIPVIPEVDDYFSGWKPSEPGRRQIVMFMGSNLGNLGEAEALSFLKKIRAKLRAGDGLLLGLDLMKNPHTVLAAYNDPEGVTAAFNLNLLHRLNRELGFDFQLDRFSHYASYSPLDGAARSFLVSHVDQHVSSPSLGLSWHLEQGETIYTEQSQKYSRAMIERMAAESQFLPAQHFTDAQGLFCLSHWRVA